MKDPTKLPTQLNVQIPWDFKEFLRDKARFEGTSQNKLVISALMDKYGREFARGQAGAPK